MLLTQLEYFVAVAREKHFGRAAAACFVSQSTLSEAVRKLEIELGAPLIRRGHAFEGLTAEGELALTWARRILADDRALRAEVGHARSRLTATVALGVIPSAVPRAAALLASLARENPHVTVRMRTGMTSEEIVHGIRHFELDGGLIHPGGDHAELLVTPLYQERLLLLASESFEELPAGPLTGRLVATLPLVLLEPHMRARQILDAAFNTYDIRLEPSVETDSVEALVSLARTGRWATIVPDAAVSAGSATTGFRSAAFVDPSVAIPIALAVLADEPRSPVVSALLRAAREHPS